MRRFAIKNTFVATISLALVFSLSGCGAGPNAATRLINQVTDGAEAKVRSADSDLMIANFLLVATEDGSAVVVGTIINRAPREDALLGIRSAMPSPQLPVSEICHRISQSDLRAISLHQRRSFPALALSQARMFQ